MEGLFNFCGDIAEADGTPLRWFCSLLDRFRSISFSMISFMVRAEPIWGKLTSPEDGPEGGRLYLSEAEMTTPDGGKGKWVGNSFFTGLNIGFWLWLPVGRPKKNDLKSLIEDK